MRSGTKKALYLCPEMLEGLGAPRPESMLTGSGEEIIDGDAAVINKNGEDVTVLFIEGVERTLERAMRKGGLTSALLKERSPSSGVDEIYINGKKCPGKGVTAAYLQRKGITVIGAD